MPRAGLSTAKVVAEAGDLADEIGWEELTLAAVADRVGVRLPSLYRHVAGAPDLRRLLAVTAKRELAGVLLAAVGPATGREALMAFGHAFRSWTLEHPGRYSATRRAPDAGDAEDVASAAVATEALFGVFEGYGLEGDQLVDAARAVRSTLDGFVTIEGSNGFGLDRSVTASFAWTLDALHLLLSAPPPST